MMKLSNTRKVPTYDIVNCGSRHRFVANGKLVHNSFKMNMQNLAARPSRNNPDGKKNSMRKSLIAPPGHVVLACDSSQVEVRVTGILSGEPNILEVFGDPKADPYCYFASEFLYHREIVKGRDKRERDVAKSAVLGNGFGQGAKGFQLYCAQSGLNISFEEAEETVLKYRSAHPRVVKLWDQGAKALEAMLAGSSLTFGYLDCLRVEGEKLYLPDGGFLTFHDLRRTYDEEGKSEISYWDGLKRARRRMYGSLLMQNAVQATAARIIHGQALAVKRKLGLTPVLQVHDELVYVVKKEKADETLKELVEIMSSAPRWLPGIPLAAEGGYGASYAEV